MNELQYDKSQSDFRYTHLREEVESVQRHFERMIDTFDPEQPGADFYIHAYKMALRRVNEVIAHDDYVQRMLEESKEHARIDGVFK